MKTEIKSLLKGCFIGTTLSSLLFILFLEIKEVRKRERYYKALYKAIDDANYGW